MSYGGRVDAEPQSVRALAGALKRYQDEVKDAGRRVRGALERARWNDPQKERFAEVLADLQRTIDRFMEHEGQDMIRDLNLLASRLDEIINKRM